MREKMKLRKILRKTRRMQGLIYRTIRKEQEGTLNISENITNAFRRYLKELNKVRRDIINELIEDL